MIKPCSGQSVYCFCNWAQRCSHILMSHHLVFSHIQYPLNCLICDLTFDPHWRSYWDMFTRIGWMDSVPNVCVCRSAAPLAPAAGWDRHTVPVEAQCVGLQSSPGPSALAPRRAPPESFLCHSHHENQKVSSILIVSVCGCECQPRGYPQSWPKH